ncbi:MAG: hypothetical protein LKE30_02465 [Bacteroidales bacterium]|jgi:hypothetical protein|nr:hypothetical protein [Bacteroidales bacterium]
MKLETPQKNKLISVVVTIIVHVLIVIFLLCVGLYYRVPPPPEMGVELDAGSIEGGGSGIEESSEEPMASTNNESMSEDENTVTQNSENVALKAKPTTKTTNKVKPKDNQPTQPKVDNNAMFHKGSVKGGGGNGNGSGVGNGKGNGSGNGVGNGTGNGGSGNGVGFSLNGRNAKSLPQPRTNKQETGKIVVEIHVDQEGNVVRATGGVRGTTIMDNNLWRLCEQAAKRAKFSPKTSAPEEQRGTITYKFRF